MDLKIINKSSNPTPKYATKGSAGLDIQANEGVSIQPGHRVLVKTGLFVELPIGTELQIRPRSGNALKYGLEVVNSPGTIDSDYRGEIGIILKNGGLQLITIYVGMKIAQAVMARHICPDIVEVEELTETERGAGGFGHSDKLG